MKHKWSIILFSSFVILTFSFLSCDRAIYDKHKMFSNSEWNIQDTAKFNIEINDSIKTYDFFIQFRNTLDYEYQNIYFFIDTYFPDKQHIRDTMQIILADKQGKWSGKGSGKFRSNKILIRPHVRFPMKGCYNFNVIQAMRDENLKGISDFGIRIEQSN